MSVGARVPKTTGSSVSRSCAPSKDPPRPGIPRSNRTGRRPSPRSSCRCSKARPCTPRWWLSSSTKNDGRDFGYSDVTEEHMHRAVIVWSAAVVVTLAVAGGLSSGFAAQGPPPALPLPEMQRLSKFYVGTWNYTETYPTGATNTGVYTSELGPGGNSIINRFHSKGLGTGDIDGLLVMTWDPTAKAYKSYVLSNDAPGALVQTGQWEGESLVFRGELTVGLSK